MVEGAGGLRFLLEAPKAIGIGGRFRMQDLDRHIPPQSLVAGAVDLPHPARAQGRQDLVRSQPDSGGEGGPLVVSGGDRHWSGNPPLEGMDVIAFPTGPQQQRAIGGEPIEEEILDGRSEIGKPEHLLAP